jgi:hypothetical protein
MNGFGKAAEDNKSFVMSFQFIEKNCSWIIGNTTLRGCIVNLMPRDTYITKLTLDSKVLGVLCVGIQSLLAFEFCIENDITGVVNSTGINADLKMQ